MEGLKVGSWITKRGVVGLVESVSFFFSGLAGALEGAGAITASGAGGAAWRGAAGFAGADWATGLLITTVGATEGGEMEKTPGLRLP